MKEIKNIPFKFDGFIPPPQCIPAEYRCNDTVTAYKRYYIGDKSSFAVWNKNRPQPLWFRKES
jgi:hypothetical protein